MKLWSKSRWIALGFLVVILNAVILFVVLPALSSRLHGFYGANEYRDGYNQLAANLVAGNGYRFYPDTALTMMRDPGYPLFLAAIFVLSHKSFLAVKLANFLLALGGAWLLMGIARNVSTNKIVIFGSAFLLLLHPGILMIESVGAYDMLFTFGLILFMFTLYRALRNNSWRDYLLSGLVLGLTCQVRSLPMLFPVFLLGYLLIFERKRIRKLTILRNVVVMTAAMCVVITPWVIRNYRLSGKLVPTADMLGVAVSQGLYIAAHPPIYGIPVEAPAAWQRNSLAQQLGYPFKRGFFQYFYSTKDEANFSHFLFERTIHRYEKSPLLLAKVVGYNLYRFWCGGQTYGGATWTSTILDSVLDLPLLALAIIGFVLSVKDGRASETAPLALTVAYLTAVTVPILAEARYSLPVVPFLSVLACIALAAAWEKVRAHARPQEDRAIAPGQASPLATGH